MIKGTSGMRVFSRMLKLSRQLFKSVAGTRSREGQAYLAQYVD